MLKLPSLSAYLVMKIVRTPCLRGRLLQMCSCVGFVLSWIFQSLFHASLRLQDSRKRAVLFVSLFFCLDIRVSVVLDFFFFLHSSLPPFLKRREREREMQDLLFYLQIFSRSCAQRVAGLILATILSSCLKQQDSIVRRIGE